MLGLHNLIPLDYNYRSDNTIKLGDPKQIKKKCKKKSTTHSASLIIANDANNC